MSENFNFKNPIVLSLITFVIITGFQIYQNYYKNKKDDDDYVKPCVFHMMKAPMIASIITWLIANFLIGSIEEKPVSNNVVINDLVVNQNLETMNNYSPENTLKNIFTDQPDF